MAEKSNFVIVTGMSGAGKSQALNCFEDIGYFCVDNLPLMILPKFVELTRSLSDKFKKVALGIDIREGAFLKNLHSTLEELEQSGISFKMLFLDADDKTLVRRFSETRRRHPLGKTVTAGIKEERKKLLPIKNISGRIINTSGLTLSSLKELVNSFVGSASKSVLQAHVMSFGYKYGVPIDADMVLDVRFLPNPNYIENLRHKTGRDKSVADFIRKERQFRIFLRKVKDLLVFLVPLFIKEGKSYLTLAVGCTGGRHRSVFVAEEIQKIFQPAGADVTLTHRDIKK